MDWNIAVYCFKRKARSLLIFQYERFEMVVIHAFHWEKSKSAEDIIGDHQHNEKVAWTLAIWRFTCQISYLSILHLFRAFDPFYLVATLLNRINKRSNIAGDIVQQMDLVCHGEAPRKSKYFLQQTIFAGESSASCFEAELEPSGAEKTFCLGIDYHLGNVLEPFLVATAQKSSTRHSTTRHSNSGKAPFPAQLGHYLRTSWKPRRFFSISVASLQGSFF
jgi:hypothetical protein